MTTIPHADGEEGREVKFTLRIEPSLIAAIERWRRQQRRPVTLAAAMRILMRQSLGIYTTSTRTDVEAQSAKIVETAPWPSKSSSTAPAGSSE